MQTIQHGRRGFTVVEIVIVVATLGSLAAVALPNLVRSRAASQTNVCIDNIRMLDVAKRQWALEHGAVAATVPQASDIQPYLGRGNGLLPVCPLDPRQSFATSYAMENCQTAPTCRILPAIHLSP